jgi:dipeptidyl aminopeptidase/acylaminoacyl peptidase
MRPRLHHVFAAGLVVSVTLAAALAAASTSAGGSTPAGPRLAFMSAGTVQGNRNNDVYVVNADGSGKRLLTRRAYGESPGWSPDGRWIGFRSYRHGNQDVYAVAADGSGEWRVTRHPAEEREPAWSPDGRKIAYVSDRDRSPTGFSEIYVAGLDGSRERRLTDNGALDFGPAWSPDGRRIAFIHAEVIRENGWQDAEIYITNADGTGAAEPHSKERARPLVRVVTRWAHHRVRPEQRRRPRYERRRRDLRHEDRRNRTAQADGQREVLRSSRLVAGRTEDRLCQQPRREPRRVGDECRRQRPAEPDAERNAGVRAGLVA